MRHSLLHLNIPGQHPCNRHAGDPRCNYFRIVDNEPTEHISALTREELADYVYAFAAIRAPNGLSQRVIFRWTHESWTEDIAALIEEG